MKILTIALCLLAATSHGRAQHATLPERVRQMPSITGWKDSSHYIEQVKENGKRMTYAVDAKSGKKTPYAPPAVPARPAVTVANGDIAYTTVTGKRMLTHTPETEKNPTLSPDGKWVAFTRDNDLYAIELASGREVRYTNDGSADIKNGHASWVYYEEIFGRSSQYRSFWWSPDSRHIAFYRFDDSRVPVFPLYNASGQHGHVEYTHYPKAGDPNPQVRVGIVPVEGGRITWGDIDPETDQYLGTPFWRPDGSGLLVQWMPREQDNLKLLEINPETGNKLEIYDERQATWVDWIEELHWLPDGCFLMVRDFDGWEQIYLHRPDGSLKQKLTSGRKWKTRIVSIDLKEQQVYFTSRGESATRNDLYRVRLDGKKQQRLTFGPYHHTNISLSPGNSYFLTRYESTSTPPTLALVNVRNGKTKLLGRTAISTATSQVSKSEILWLKTEEGFELPALVYWPAGMQPGKRYPLDIHVYGGPGTASVVDHWSTPDSRQGQNTIKVVLDHRGSGHCGKAGMNYMHRNLGKWEMADYTAWVKLLSTYPCVDSTRVMISGGSYGGYLTILALTREADHFQYGYAQYGVTDWMLYDSHYTERYMDAPKDNPEGYKAASVFTYLDRYRSRGDAMLRIVHGMMDDNVHVQQSIQLVDSLQRLDKRFEMMFFPYERHGWRGGKLRFSLQDRQNFKEHYLLHNKENNLKP